MKILALFAGILACLFGSSCVGTDAGQNSVSAPVQAENIGDVQITFYHALFDMGEFNEPGVSAVSLFKRALDNKTLTTFGILNTHLGSTASFTNAKQLRYQESLDGKISTADVGTVVEVTPVADFGDASSVSVTMNPKRTSRLDDIPLTVKGENFPQPSFSVIETRATFSAKLDTPVVFMVRPQSHSFDGKGDYAGKLEVFFFVIKKLN